MSSPHKKSFPNLFSHKSSMLLCTMNYIQIEGTLMAPPRGSLWSKKTNRHWILFNGVNGLTVTGGGTIDGNGKLWWQKSCKFSSRVVSTFYLLWWGNIYSILSFLFLKACWCGFFLHFPFFSHVNKLQRLWHSPPVKISDWKIWNWGTASKSTCQ